MTIRNSQRWCEIKSGKAKATITAITLAIVDGGGSDDTITDSGNGLVAAGFEVGDWIEIVGATLAANDIYKPILAITAGQINIPTGSFSAAQSAGNSLTIRARYRASFAEQFRDAQLDIYSGSIPTTPDDAEAGTLLVSFTGARFGNAVWDSTNKYSYVDLLSTLTTNAVASGTATWWRLRGGGSVATGASTSLVRIDGKIGIVTGDLQISNTDIKLNAPQSVSSLRIRSRQVAAA